MKILWLASWYPSYKSDLVGDFIQRHAIAASIHHDIKVLNIKRVDNIQHPKKILEYKRSNSLLERIVLYQPKTNRITLIQKIISSLTWWRIIHGEIKLWIQTNGKPTFLHVHVTWKVGLAALYFKLFYRIPYIITEHYSGFLSETKDNLTTFSFWEQVLLKLVFKQAKKVCVVSNTLGDALKKRYGIDYERFCNVVDTQIFHPEESIKTEIPPFTILHVSNLMDYKDPDTLFGGFFLFCQVNTMNIRIVVIAPSTMHEQYRTVYPTLLNKLVFLPEIAQEELAVWMQKADLLVLCSKLESFGLVVYESIACGTPVLLSDLPVFKEFLAEKPFVYFAKKGDAEDLAIQLEHIVQQSKKDSSSMFQLVEEQFSYKIIAEKFKELYNSI